jgi:hypothetical protein
MGRSRKTKIVAAGAALGAVVSAAAALGASGALSPGEESQAVLNDAAEQLGVEPSELSKALKEALKNRVDAAVEAGRLTEEQAAELKERIDAGDVPLIAFGFGHHGAGHHHVLFDGFDTAASYLGLTEAELRSRLDDGKTLAEVAKAEDKTVDGLVNAMVAAARQDLNQAVEDGRLTDAQRDEIASSLTERVTELVNRDLPGPPGVGGRGPWGPPPAGGSNGGSGSGSAPSAETSVA